MVSPQPGVYQIVHQHTSCTMGSDRNNPEVACSRCGQRGHWFAARWGPFCSERCQLIDLGQWFNEEHRMSRPLTPGDFEGFDELPPGPELDRDRGENA